MKIVYCDIVNIDGPILQVKGAEGVGMGEEAILPGFGRAKVVKIQGDTVFMQSLEGSLGVVTTQKTEFTGHPFELPFDAELIMGRVFDGVGRPRDGRPDITGDQVLVEGPVVNPVRRAVGQGYIETGNSSHRWRQTRLFAVRKFRSTSCRVKISIRLLRELSDKLVLQVRKTSASSLVV